MSNWSGSSLEKTPRASSGELKRLQLRAQAEAERRRRASGVTLTDYRYQPVEYIRQFLGWTPWSGTAEEPGQVQILEAYATSLAKQHERRAFDRGELTEDQLQHYVPGEVIKTKLRVGTGHSIGKTKLASGIVNHFFDTCPPAIVYTYAPTWEQIHDLLWKEIKVDRKGKGLPGRVLDLALVTGRDDHFAKGKATNNAGGAGTERAQGQHNEYLLFVVDEAEGVADFLWGAIDSMASGGIVIVLVLANPKTRSSKFHKLRKFADVINFRVSSLSHPNVVAGKEIITGAATRPWALGWIDRECEAVAKHSADDYTFTVPYPVTVKGEPYPAGQILKPSAVFCWRILGIPPANVADKTFVSPGSYDAAVARKREAVARVLLESDEARIGLDCARYGSDLGTGYVYWRGEAWRFAVFAQEDTHQYSGEVEKLAKWLHAQGCRKLSVRVDGGGGFGAGPIDNVKASRVIKGLFPGKALAVHEVHFGGNPSPENEDSYADKATELYAEAAETLKGIRLDTPPEELEDDLIARQFKWVNRGGVHVRRLTPKEDFKKNNGGRSPDDGDGLALCLAPEFCFPPVASVVTLADLKKARQGR